MKYLKIAVLSLFMFNSAYGQLHANITNLRTSESGITVAEISLLHISRDTVPEHKLIGKTQLMIPSSLMGQSFKIEYYRFLSHAGRVFELEGKVYVSVSVYYDNETLTPKDDVFIASMPIEIDKDLAIEELNHYEDKDLITDDFNEAPHGESSQGPVKKIKAIYTK